jgi:hypothetical protein
VTSHSALPVNKDAFRLGFAADQTCAAGSATEVTGISKADIVERGVVRHV